MFNQSRSMVLDSPLVAALLTECGPLQIYSVQALREIVGVLPKCSWGSCGASLTAAHDDAAAIAPSTTSNRDQSRSVVEGWDLGQWRHWGRKKSALASSICKLNGVLKARIADLEIQIGAAATSKSVKPFPDSYCPTSEFSESGDANEDPLLQNDPWRNRYTRDATTIDTEARDAWARWRPQRLRRGKVRKLALQHIPAQQWTDTSTDLCDEPYLTFVAQPRVSINSSSAQKLEGCWQSLPASAWQCLHSRFTYLNRSVNDGVETTSDTEEESKTNIPAATHSDFVKATWPASRGMRMAANHWYRYGHNATLPAFDLNIVEQEGLSSDLVILRDAFEYAMAANPQRGMWRE